MSKKKIKNNPSILKLKEDIETISELKKSLPELGINTDKVDFSKINEMKDKLNRIADIPDRFNDYFAKEGWIAFEL
jgi:hypothetical protein